MESAQLYLGKELTKWISVNSKSIISLAATVFLYYWKKEKKNHHQQQKQFSR